jgi:hypothetical protein
MFHVTQSKCQRLYAKADSINLAEWTKALASVSLTIVDYNTHYLPTQIAARVQCGAYILQLQTLENCQLDYE